MEKQKFNTVLFVKLVLEFSLNSFLLNKNIELSNSVIVLSNSDWLDSKFCIFKYFL